MRSMLVSLSLLAACGGGSDFQPDCTTEAVPSIVVDATTSEGTPIAPDAVYYRIDGGPEEEGSCLDDDCMEWVTAYEEVGEFEVRAEWCGMEASATRTVVYDTLQCHPVTQYVTLRMPEECTTAR